MQRNFRPLQACTIGLLIVKYLHNVGAAILSATTEATSAHAVPTWAYAVCAGFIALMACGLLLANIVTSPTYR
jgi:hypothetical protein